MLCTFGVHLEHQNKTLRLRTAQKSLDMAVIQRQNFIRKQGKELQFNTECFIILKAPKSKFCPSKSKCMHFYEQWKHTIQLP